MSCKTTFESSKPEKKLPHDHHSSSIGNHPTQDSYAENVNVQSFKPLKDDPSLDYDDPPASSLPQPPPLPPVAAGPLLP